MPSTSTVKGGLRLAIKRNVGHHLGADAVSCILDVDATRQTVATWEIHVANCLLAASDYFFRDLRRTLTAWQRSQSYMSSGHVVHCLRTDATNANVFQGSKVQALELTTHLAVAVKPGPLLATWYDREVVTSWGDVQRCSGGAASDCLGLVNKTLKQLGFTQLDALASSSYADMLHAWVMPSDAGPDVKKRELSCAMRCSARRAGASSSTTIATSTKSRLVYCRACSRSTLCVKLLGCCTRS